MNGDISALLLRIKENIKVIEGGDTGTPLLDEVCSDFLEMVELMKLFLISERDSYYGYFLMNMQFRADFRSNSIAGIKLNTFPPVFEANPLLLCKFKLKEILYVMCHEIDHVVLNHPAEMVKANPQQDPDRFYEFNLAADASVNDRIDHEIKKEAHNFLAHPDGIITSETLAKMYHLGSINALENYAYYFSLIQGKEKDQNHPSNGSQSMMDEQNKKDGIQQSNAGQGTGKDASSEGENDAGQGNGADSSDEGGENDQGQKSGAEGSQDVVTAKNCGGNIQDHNWEVGEDEEDAAAAVRELVNAAVGMMNEETRGLMPAEFMSQVDKLNKPPVLPWQTILKKYVGTITANKRKTRMRLNRRQPERFDLSGSVDDKVLKIVVAMDTSGSVNDQMISQILNEILAILAKRRHDITVIECDASVQRVYKVRTPADVQMKVKGRGGTSFTPAIEYINGDKYYRDALLIYFTDGYGEDEIPRPRTYRNMWVVIGDTRHLSVEEPYGVVLSL